jgi:hypothetical protein
MTHDELNSMLKGEFQDYEIIDIQIAGVKNDQFVITTISAVRLSDDWALHPRPTGDAWTCTYIPNGYGIGHYDTITQACMALGVLIAADLPWHLITDDTSSKQILHALPDVERMVKKAFKTIKAMDVIREEEYVID